MEINRQNIELFCLENIAWFLALFFYLTFAIVKPSAMLSFDMVTFMIYSVIPLGFLVLAQSVCLITGNLDLSIGAMTGFVGMAAGLFLATNKGVPFYLAILVPIGLGMLCGAANGFLIGPMEFSPFLVTLGTLMVFTGGRFLIYKSTIMGRDLPKLYLVLGGNPVLSIVSFIIILACFGFVLKYSRFGVHLYASGGGPQTASMLGINLKKHYFAAFLISGFLCGLSALYYTGYNNSVTVTMGDESLFPAFAGSVIGGVSLTGGRGSITNAFAGTVLLGFIEGGLTLFAISPTERTVVYGLLVIAAIAMNKARDYLRDSILRWGR